ncbi:MAG: hypothetical protein WBM08_03500 [Prochlorococcaceae cyanobacterium]
MLEEAGSIEGREQGRWMNVLLRPQAIEQLRVWLGDPAVRSQAQARSCGT